MKKEIEETLNLKQVLSLDIDVVTMHTCMNIDECNNPQITMVKNRIVKEKITLNGLDLFMNTYRS